MSRDATIRREVRRGLFLLPAIVVAAALAAPDARAYIYWTNGDGGTIGRANLDGSGANQNFIVNSNRPYGVAVDGAHVYWANYSGETIGRANLDGSAADQGFVKLEHGPRGVAVDSSHLFWAELFGEIGRTNLDGSGLEKEFIGPLSQPSGPAVDGAHVYWAEFETDSIGRSNLDGQNVDSGFIEGANNPTSVAVDATHVYWVNQGASSIGRANLNGTGIEQSFIPTAAGGVPIGIGLDATHIYWTNAADGTIGRANLDGSGVNQAFITGADGPTGIATDALPLPPAPPTAAPSGKFRLGKLRLDRKHGTAKLTVRVPGPGRLVLSGKKVQQVKKKATKAGQVRLPIRPKRAARRQLSKKHRLKVKIKVVYRPEGGTASAKSRRLSLIKRP
jgi:sugar lactone lactonase YvrE